MRRSSVGAGASFGVIRTEQDASLTAASLSFADASPAVDINLGDLANSTAPSLHVGTLTVSGTVTLNFSKANLISGGRVTLIKFGTLRGTPTFVLGTVPSTLAGKLAVDADSVDFVVESTIAGFRWSGANGPTWDFTTMNWVNTFDNTPAAYQDGYNTEFFDGPANTPGQTPSSDSLSVGGTITAGGTLVVVLAPGAATPAAGQTFQLFSKGVSGFASITLPDLPEGSSWDTAALATTGSLSVSGAVAPSIGSVGVTGGQFTFSGTGGTPGATYYIMTSEDVAAPASAWTPVVTNVFDAAGAFSFSTNVGQGSAFFRLQVP